MKTLEMMNLTLCDGKRYSSDDLFYSSALGFTDSQGSLWPANAFNSIDEVMEIDDWEVELARKMTQAEIERELGYKIKIVKEFDF